MRVLRSIDEVRTLPPSVLGSPVLTVGTFDGLHLGHQFLLNELLQWSGNLGCASAVLTFDAHPRTVIAHEAARRILPLGHKLCLLDAMGIDITAVVPFDDALRALTAHDFCSRVVAGAFNARGLLLGHNNAVGKGREGTHDVLRRLGEQLGFEARQAARVEVDGAAISSSAIRTHIANGDFLWARKMLGRPYTIRGTVTSGRKLGRTIGFPTINLPLTGLVHPPHGVYGVRVTLSGQPQQTATGTNANDSGRYRLLPRELAGAANLGVRPTVDHSRTEPLLEVHLLDWEGDCYGQDAEVEFVFRVRDEQKFDGLAALKAKLAADVLAVRARISRAG